VGTVRNRPPGTAVPLRVASYNIQAGIGTDGVFDLDRTAAALRDTGADVIGLQEVDGHWSDRSEFADEAEVLARSLGMNVYFAPIYALPTIGAPDRRFGTAVLSRFPIVWSHDHEFTRLSTQDADPRPAPAPGFPEVRILVHGAMVRVFATHLDYRADPGIRARQVTEMLHLIGSEPRRTVLLGDFNAQPDAPELIPLWTTLVDALAKSTDIEQPTFPAATPDRRLDFVVVSPDVEIGHAFVPDFAGVQASDHRPAVADLRIDRWW
jgi:endonuclease/exonuclease/phosphatase family metal-dependent hydrolase